jgi:hypothetical protein
MIALLGADYGSDSHAMPGRLLAFGQQANDALETASTGRSGDV